MLPFKRPMREAPEGMPGDDELSMGMLGEDMEEEELLGDEEGEEENEEDFFFTPEEAIKRLEDLGFKLEAPEDFTEDDLEEELPESADNFVEAQMPVQIIGSN